MPVFIYRAKDGPGRTVEGEISAESVAAAVAAVDAMGYSPVWVREKPAGQPAGVFRRRRASRRDITVFTRQLATLTRSHVPILKALATIGAQTENEELRRVIGGLEAAVREGKMLSEAMGQYPRHFSDLFISMVRAGEWSGHLDTILLRLAAAREQEEEMRRKVQTATAYPLLVLGVGLVTVFVLLAFFMPRVVALFRDYSSLPLPTRWLIGVSGIFSGYWPWMVLGGLLGLAMWRRLISSESGRLIVDRLKLRLPLIGTLVLGSEIGRFARTLGLLINAGVTIDKALELSAYALGNRALREEVLAIRRSAIQQGMVLSDGLRRSRLFPSFVANMTAVGEETGCLDETLNEVASFYEGEVEHQTRLVISFIEPVLILVVGGIVGLIVAAMLLPIFNLGAGLR